MIHAFLLNQAGGILPIDLKEGTQLQTHFRATFKQQIFMIFIVEYIFKNEI